MALTGPVTSLGIKTYAAADRPDLYSNPGGLTEILNQIDALLLGGRQLDYAQITASPAAVTATTEGTAVAQITGASVAYDGTKVKIEVFVPAFTSTGGNSGILVLLRDATVIGQFKTVIAGAATTLQALTAEVFDTPSAANHIYKLAMFATGTSIQVNAGAGGSGSLVPAFLRVTKA